MSGYFEDDYDVVGSTGARRYKVTMCAKRIKRRARRLGVHMTWRQARALAARRVVL